MGTPRNLLTSPLAVYWFCVVVIFVALRLNISDAELNIDELIPIKISEGMSARGDLDPNWRLADLPWFWNIDQYNFYLYNMVAHGVPMSTTKRMLFTSLGETVFSQKNR